VSDIDLAPWSASSPTALLALHLACEIGGRRVLRLLELFGSAEAALIAQEPRLREVLAGAVPARIAAGGWTEAAEKEQARVAELGGRLLHCGHPGYPRYLQHLPDPPPVLYALGTLEVADERAVAVVGSRAASSYGRSVTRALARDLARAHVTVISGLARGIDAAAHRSALEAGGRSLAVLGSGLDRPYPPEHATLIQQLAASAGVVTEFALGTPPVPTNFPVRNRIIAGLALATVVVEAAPKSGALITARLANDYGRSVFAVPGSVGSLLSAGPHELIRQGALLVQSAADVLAALGWSLPPESVLETGDSLPAAPSVEILNALEPRGESVSVDELCQRLRRTPQELLPQLIALEACGAIQSAPGMRFLLPI
jgi:DNA processing protein